MRAYAFDQPTAVVVQFADGRQTMTVSKIQLDPATDFVTFFARDPYGTEYVQGEYRQGCVLGWLLAAPQVVAGVERLQQ